jgi:hypothetical protein
VLKAIIIFDFEDNTLYLNDVIKAMSSKDLKK